MTILKLCLALLSVGILSSCADMENAMTQLNNDLSKLANATNSNTPTKRKTLKYCEKCAGSGWIPHYEEMDGQLLRDRIDCPDCNGRARR